MLRLAPHAVVHVGGQAVTALAGSIVIDARRPLLLVAEGESVLLLPALVRVTVRHGEVRLRIDQGAVTTGRRYRSGSRLRWRRGRSPHLIPWPRGRSVSDHVMTMLPDVPPSSGSELDSYRQFHAEMRVRLLRVARLGFCPNRHLVLALLLETGTPEERMAAAGLCTLDEAMLLRDVLRRARSHQHPGVSATATATLERAGVDVPPSAGAFADMATLHAPGQRGTILDHPAVFRFVVEDVMRCRRAEAAWLCAFHSADRSRRARARERASDLRTHAIVDALASDLETCGEGEVASIASALVRVLGRGPGAVAVADLGLRFATLLFVRTLRVAFQPPGKDLLFL